MIHFIKLYYTVNEEKVFRLQKPMNMIWDEEHLKALLHLGRYPKQLLDQEP